MWSETDVIFIGKVVINIQPTELILVN
jgi:hypothetical protein